MASAKKVPAVRVTDLTKRFGKLTAVRDLSFEIWPGEVFGILGSNGAGKSTTLKIICGLLRPDEGTVEVAGIDTTKRPVEAKRHIGYLPEAPVLYDQLTGQEFLHMIATLRGLPSKVIDKRVDDLLEIMELTQFRDANVGTYSRGMRQKLAFSASVLHEPRILILDEPLTGLDPRYGKLFKKWIREHAGQGRTVLICTHVTSTAEEICDRVAIVDKGTVISEGTVDVVKKMAGASTLEDAFVTLVGGERWRRLPSSRRTA